jgi:K(+)-stimulated pyrophosphate-energized sodium pump
MNPIIKFTTLFGLLATEIALAMTRNYTEALKTNPHAVNWAPWIGGGCFLVALVFVYRSFYCMRIPVDENSTEKA